MFKDFSLRPNAPGLILNFMLSAVTSILSVRLFLHLTNNFQLTFGRYHIAHVLWGGLIMAFAFMLIFLFSSPSVFRISASVAGFGWGWFIDEVGKYITRDNNYWYQPAIIYIYVSFVLLYFLYRFSLKKIPFPPASPAILTSLRKKIIHFRPLFVVLSVYSIYYAIDKIIDIGFEISSPPESYLVYLKIITDLLIASFIIFGWVYYLSRHRRTGLKLFRLSLLLNIFLGAVIKFYFEQFSAVFSLAVSILVLNYINVHKTGKTPPNLL